jgi:hypothetical protein
MSYADSLITTSLESPKRRQTAPSRVTRAQVTGHPPLSRSAPGHPATGAGSPAEYTSGGRRLDRPQGAVRPPAFFDLFGDLSALDPW